MRFLHLVVCLLGCLFASETPIAPKLDAAEPAITHGFLACGNQTYIVDGAGTKIWTYPHATRDGYVLPDGVMIFARNKGKEYPGGAVVEVTRDGQETLVWQGTQSEVNSVQPTLQGTFVLTEAGPRPRLLEVNRSGVVLVEFALDCQKENHHMQTRMARKLENGTYLVPHLLNFAVRNYDQSGKVLTTLDTTVPGDPNRVVHSWPFTAIRHSGDHTLVCCTNGNRVIDFDGDGKVVWQLNNADLPGEWLQDPCGGQVLPNGNIVITSYAAGRKDPNAPKMIEVTPDKKVVWTYRDGASVGIHHFQIMDVNGESLTESPLK